MSSSAYTQESLVEEFNRAGFFVVPDCIEPPAALAWGRKIKRSRRLRHIATPEYERVVDAGGGSNEHWSLDSGELQSLVPEIEDIYHSVYRDYIQPLHPAAIASPYPRSKFYVKVYRPPGGAQGWHYDTNSYSGILYLTNNAGDGATEVISRLGSTELILPEAGKLLVLDGRRCWHRATTTTRSSKVTVLLNYYDKGHRPRDPMTDVLLFGD